MLTHTLPFSVTPALATVLVGNVGPESPGFLLSILAIIGLLGLWRVAPPMPQGLSDGAGASASAKADFAVVPSHSDDALPDDFGTRRSSVELDDEDEII